MKKLIISIVLSFVICPALLAQPKITLVQSPVGVNNLNQVFPSNTTILTPAINPPAQVQVPANIKADLEKLFADILESIGFSGTLQTVLAGWLTAFILRKLIPDGWQVNKLGLMLAHFTEVNPTIEKLAAAAAAQAMQAAKTAPTNAPIGP